MIKVLIDISVEDYKNVMAGRYPVLAMHRAIVNGKILPEGHGDLIDRNLLRAGFADEMCTHRYYTDRDIIDVLTTMLDKAEPVITGIAQEGNDA